jgi:hypothetical protein
MVNRRHDSLALRNPQWLTASSANNAGEPSNFTSAVLNRARLYGARKERLLGFLGVDRQREHRPSLLQSLFGYDALRSERVVRPPAGP